MQELLEVQLSRAQKEKKAHKAPVLFILIFIMSWL